MCVMSFKTQQDHQSHGPRTPSNSKYIYICAFCYATISVTKVYNKDIHRF